MYSNTPESIRPGFTDDNDNEMWRFLLKKLNEPDYGPARLPNGLVLWRDFIKEEPRSKLAQKTESNLASHFRKSMRGRIMDSNLTNDEIRFIFKALHWNMGKKEELILNDRISPVPFKPRIFVNIKSPAKRSILLSNINASGFIDSDVEQGTPRKKVKRQLQYGKLDDDVFVRPSTRIDDEDSVDFLFDDSSQNRGQKRNAEEESNSQEGNEKENDGDTSDTSSYDSLEHLGSKTPSARRQFRPNVDVSETSEETTPVHRRSRRIESHRKSQEMINKILADSNIIVESVALQSEDIVEDQPIQNEAKTRKKKESTEKFTDVNENGTSDKQTKEILIEETSVEGTDTERGEVDKERNRLNEKRNRIHEEISRITEEINRLHKEKSTPSNEKNKVNGALERRPPTVNLSNPIIEVNANGNSEEIVIEEGNDLSQEANRTLTATDDVPSAEIQVVENPTNPVPETTDHRPDSEVQVLEPNPNTEAPPETNYEFAPVTLSCMRVAFHYANGDDVTPDDDALATAMKLEISRSLDQYLRTLVQHFKNDNYANEKNPNGIDPASSVESLPYYT